MSETGSEQRNLWDGKPGESLFYKPILELLKKNELPELFRKVEGMHDHRLLAIVTALIVEDRVDKALSAFLPKYKKLTESKDFSFSMKINLLEAFNFIPIRITTSCHCLRNIRNDFAHNLEKKDLSDVEDKYLRPLLALRAEAFRGFEKSAEGEMPLSDVFKGLSFYCIVGLDTYAGSIGLLRQTIWEQQFMDNMEAKADADRLRLIESIVALSRGTETPIEL